MSKAWVCVLVIGLAAGVAVGKEETGKVLTSLVESVDKKLQALEDDTAKQTEKRKDEQERLVKANEQLKTTTNDLDRLDAESTIIGNLAELNLVDRRQVSSTLSTIVSVVGDLERINGVLEEGKYSPEKMKAQRERINAAIQGVVPILDALKNLDDPKARMQAESTKATVVMLARQLKMVGAENTGFVRQIRDTKDTLEEVAVQLKLVNDLLELEREVLTVASHTQIAKLVMGRLSLALAGKHDVVGAPSKIQTGVLNRMQQFGKIWSEPGSSPVSLGAMTEDDEAIWSDLVNSGKAGKE